MANIQFFEKYDQAVDKLTYAGKHEESIKLLEQALAELPDERMVITMQILYAHRTLENYDKCLQIIDECVKDGFFYDLRWDSWKPIRALEGAAEIWVENDRLRSAAQENAKMRYEVHLPDNYDSTKSYPLFMTMHGNGVFGSIEHHSHLWKSDVMLKHGFIVAYVQSSNVSCTNGHSWVEDLERDRDDLLACYNALKNDYKIDRSDILVGGFSGGAEASLNLVLNNTIPATGFMAICPDKPPAFTEENVKNMAKRGVRGVIIEGEQTGDVPVHQEMLAMCKAANVPCEYIIAEGVGHWYPLDMPAMIEEAIQFITNRP